MTRVLLALLLLLLFGLAWQGVASLESVDDLTLASPVETWGARHQVSGWHPDQRTERIESDLHAGALSHDVIKPDDVARAHADTTIAGRGSDLSFLRRSVDVDVAAVGVLILRLEAAQPENPGHDRVPAGGIDRNDLARWLSALEFHARRSPAAKFFRDFEASERRAICAGVIAEAKSRG